MTTLSGRPVTSSSPTRYSPVETATAIRVRNGKLSTADGPFVEAKEQLGSFRLIEARDLNEAIRWPRTPMARPDSIEVRPIKELRL